MKSLAASSLDSSTESVSGTDSETNTESGTSGKLSSTAAAESVSIESELLSPTDLPEADVVIYDGHCKFCLAQVKRLNWWDGKNRLCYVSLHDDFVKENYPELSYEQLMEQMYVVERSTGAARGGARAIRYLSRRLPKLWLAMPFLHIPLTLPIWQWMYRQVAKRRYQIAGKNQESNCEDEACKVHYKD